MTLSTVLPANAGAETYGWDTVFALRVADVNAAIHAAGTSPPHFSYRSADGWTAEADFASWQMASSGDGKLVHFTIPITAGKMLVNDREIGLAGISALLELELAYFESTKQPVDPADGINYDLKVKSKAVAVADKVATVLELDIPDEQMAHAFTLQALLPDALESWLNEHLELFDHIFATVNLNKYVAKDQFAWVAPTATDYAFMSKENADDSILGVLCMTEHRPIQGLSPQLSPNAIPPGSRAGYLISKGRYLEKLLKPAMPYAFQGAKASDFELSTDGNSLVLINKDLAFTVDHDGDTYNATLEEMSITVEDTFVKLFARTHTPLDMGVTAFCESTHIYRIKLKNKSDGTPTLVYEETGDPTVKQWTTQSDGDEILKWILAIITAIMVIILGILTAGAAFVAGALVIGLLMGTAIMSPEIVQLVGKDDAPDISMLTLNVTDPIVWPGQDVFELNWAGLNGPLQLGGIFHYNPK